MLRLKKPHQLLLLTMLATLAAQVKSDSALDCGFCDSGRTLGEAFDEAWATRHTRLYGTHSEPKLLRFFSEPKLGQLFAGSFIEYSCFDGNGESEVPESSSPTLAVTIPGKLFFSPWQVKLSHSIVPTCDEPLPDEFINILAHESFHVRASIQAQIEAPDSLGILAIRNVAARVIDRATLENLDVEGRGIQLIRSIQTESSIGGSEELRSLLTEAKSVFYNSLMAVACEEALAYRVSGSTWEEAAQRVWDGYWSSDEAYYDYFFDTSWQRSDFLTEMLGPEAKRCRPMLEDSAWYEEDKQTR